MNERKYIIEIATSDIGTTRSAVAGGADRIELCANLAEGGTTASFGYLRKARELFLLPIFPIIRARGGDFLYTEEEFSVMRSDALACKDLGFEGIVTGFLNEYGSIDIKRTAAIVEAVYPLGVTFHRAFDRCRDPYEAMEQLISIGCERILTSGQQLLAPDGVGLIAGLNAAAGGRITIMPGSGIRKENIARVAATTGCTEFHSSLRATIPSPMRFVHPGFANSAESYRNSFIDPAEVSALRDALAHLQ